MKALFRGKRIDNGEWIEGSLIEDPSGNMTIVQHVQIFRATNYIGVHPETVGQYTGLDDKDGRRIFKGDKCSFEGVEEFGIAVWDEWCWGWDFDGEIQALCEFEPQDIEVIGSIHDSDEVK